MGTFGSPLNSNGWRYRGFEFGSGKTFPTRLLEVTGLFDTNIRNADRVIPRGDGALRGNDYSLPKEIILDLRIVGERGTDGYPSASLLDRVLAAETAFQRSETDVYPLEFRYPGEGTRFVNARVVARTRPRRWSTELGIVPLSVRLKASDPRIYGIDEHSASLGPYDTASGGLDYPAADYPKEFAAGTGGDVSLTNGGNDTAFPVFRFYGPSAGTQTAVEITNRTTGESFEVVEDMTAGQILTVDMAALVDGSGRSSVTLDGVSRYGSWTPPRDPVGLAPGTNILRFTPSGTTTDSQAVVTWRDTSQ